MTPPAEVIVVSETVERFHLLCSECGEPYRGAEYLKAEDAEYFRKFHEREHREARAL